MLRQKLVAVAFALVPGFVLAEPATTGNRFDAAVNAEITLEVTEADPAYTEVIVHSATDPHLTLDRFAEPAAVVLWSKLFDATLPLLPTPPSGMGLIRKGDRVGVRIALKASIPVRSVTASSWSKQRVVIRIPKPTRRTGLASAKYLLGEPALTTTPKDGRLTEVIPLSFADPGRVCYAINQLSDTNSDGTHQILAQPYAARILSNGTLMQPPPMTASSGSVSATEATAGQSNVTSSRVRLADIHIDTGSAPFKYIIVRAVAEDMAWIRHVVAQLDKKPTQVCLEIKVCEISTQDLDDLGIDAQGVRNGTDFTDGLGFTLREDARPGVDAGREFEAISLGDFFRSSGLEIRTLLSALQQTGRAQILAEPNLKAIDGQLASYFAGELVPYVETIPNTSDSGTNPATVSYKNVGVELQFIPRVDDFNETVTIHVVPVVSSVTALIQLGDGSTAPQVGIRQAESMIRVRDGETFVLAGMIKDQELESIRKVPILSDIPVLGKMFRHRVKTSDHTELCVFVTPHIIPDEEVF
jgi:type II secretory pathway component GspD/PulD (secretin)